MGYMLLYVIQGSDSVLGPYIRRGAHPPPHRHRGFQRNWHTTTPRGFPGDRAGALSLGGPCREIPPLAGDLTTMCQSCYTSAVHVSHWWITASIICLCVCYVTRGQSLLWGGVWKFSSIMMCVYWWHTGRRAIRERSDSGLDLTPNRGFCTFKVSGNARY